MLNLTTPSTTPGGTTPARPAPRMEAPRPQYIELKANVNAKMKDGTTPLKLARKGDQEEIIALLEAAGAKQ